MVPPYLYIDVQIIWWSFAPWLVVGGAELGLEKIINYRFWHDCAKGILNDSTQPFYQKKLLNWTINPAVIDVVKKNYERILKPSNVDS